MDKKLDKLGYFFGQGFLDFVNFLLCEKMKFFYSPFVLKKTNHLAEDFMIEFAKYSNFLAEHPNFKIVDPQFITVTLKYKKILINLTVTKVEN